MGAAGEVGDEVGMRRVLLLDGDARDEGIDAFAGQNMAYFISSSFLINAIIKGVCPF